MTQRFRFNPIAFNFHPAKSYFARRKWKMKMLRTYDTTSSTTPGPPASKLPGGTRRIICYSRDFGFVLVDLLLSFFLFAFVSLTHISGAFNAFCFFVVHQQIAPISFVIASYFTGEVSVHPAWQQSLMMRLRKPRKMIIALSATRTIAWREVRVVGLEKVKTEDRWASGTREDLGYSRPELFETKQMAVISRIHDFKFSKHGVLQVRTRNLSI